MLDVLDKLNEWMDEWLKTEWDVNVELLRVILSTQSNTQSIMLMIVIREHLVKLWNSWCHLQMHMLGMCHFIFDWRGGEFMHNIFSSLWTLPNFLFLVASYLFCSVWYYSINTFSQVKSHFFFILPFPQWKIKWVVPKL